MLIGFIDRRFWAKACACAVYLKNRLQHSAIKGMIPYEAFHGKKPWISYLQLFGKECYVYIPKESWPSGSKLLPWSEKGIFIGYTESPIIYKVYLTDCCHTTTVEVKDVIFVPLKPIISILLIPTKQQEATAELSTPTISSTTTLVTVPLHTESFPSDYNWQQYLFWNPDSVQQWYDQGNPIV